MHLLEDSVDVDSEGLDSLSTGSGSGLLDDGFLSGSSGHLILKLLRWQRLFIQLIPVTFKS